MVREVKPQESEIENLFQDKCLVYDLSESQFPTAIIFAGVSGSGKSTLIKQMYSALNLNYFPIQADDYRSSHPKITQYIEKYGRDEAHKKTGNFAHRVARGLLDKAVKNNLNVVYETTFNNIETASSLLDIFKQYQYRIIIVALPVNVELSIVRNRQRYESKLSIDGTLPRIVEKEVIERMATNYQTCIEQLQADRSLQIFAIANFLQAKEILSTVL